MFVLEKWLRKKSLGGNPVVWKNGLKDFNLKQVLLTAGSLSFDFMDCTVKKFHAIRFNGKNVFKNEVIFFPHLLPVTV